MPFCLNRERNAYLTCPNTYFDSFEDPRLFSDPNRNAPENQGRGFPSLLSRTKFVTRDDMLTYAS